MNQGIDQAMGLPGATSKAPGHWVLARLGKRVLRPGGLELTRELLDALRINASDDVVEFAPGLGATAKMTLERSPHSYVAVERDERAAHGVSRLLEGPDRRCLVGRAEATGLPDRCATVVYGEAMLTMQSMNTKERIVREAARLLSAGGRYGIHEVALRPDAIAPELAQRVSRSLTDAIHHTVLPLTVSDWRTLLQSNGFGETEVHSAPMHLLEPRRLLADEGLGGALRFAWNMARDRESRSRVLQMRSVFRKFADHLQAVALVGIRA